MLRKFIGVAGFGAFLLVAASLLTFGAFELFPPLLDRVDLWSIRYYAIRAGYAADPTLVVRYRRSGGRWDRPTFKGDLYGPSLGVDAPVIAQSRSYDVHGFRVGSSRPPFDVVVIGDSYMETGETDGDTTAELLAATSGRSILNLGHGFYGPHQYVEVLNRHGLKEAPRFALLCFFSGNDVEDMRQYERWLREGRYYFFEDLFRRSFAERYWMALSSTTARLREVVTAGLEALSRGDGEIHPELAVLKLGEKSATVRMRYWEEPIGMEERLASKEWQTLRRLLREFQSLCARHGITPVVVFVPTKAQMYAPYVTPESGEAVLKKLPTQLRFGRSSAQSLARIAADLDLRLIDLTPRFESLAAEGRLLYHPFDTHWNREGRQAAAEFIAGELGWR